MSENSKSKVDLTALVEDHSDYLLSYAMFKLDDLELAKDLVQDTFFSALTNIDSFESRSKLKTWLTSILSRKIIDHWRKAETKYTDPVSRFFDQKDKIGHWIENQSKGLSTDNIEKSIEQNETLTELSDCMDALPKKWKAIMASKYLNQKESESICKEFDITSSNLWVIMHRAKLLLRECLQSKFN